MKTCLVPKYLQQKQRAPVKKDSKVVLLYSLQLPKDTLNIIKDFVFYDDEVRTMMKKTFKSVIRDLSVFGQNDYEAEELWEDDYPQTTYCNVYWCWDKSSTMCLLCGNYLCCADTCYGHHSQRVHCLCEQQRDRIHNHFM